MSGTKDPLTYLRQAADEGAEAKRRTQAQADDSFDTMIDKAFEKALKLVAADARGSGEKRGAFQVHTVCPGRDDFTTTFTQALKERFARVGVRVNEERREGKAPYPAGFDNKVLWFVVTWD